MAHNASHVREAGSMPYAHHLLGSLKGLISALLVVLATQQARAMKVDYIHFELKVCSFRNHSVIYLGLPFAN
jgi:hypothetical protein